MAEKVLELRSMETRQKLPASQNTNLIIIGADEEKLPLFLQQGVVEETEKPKERDISDRD